MTDEVESVAAAVVGVVPDHRLVWDAPASLKELQHAATDMVQALLAFGCEFYTIMHEPERNRVVGDGWYAKPEIMAKYVPPPLVEKKSGMAMDLTPMDRARLRNIVRKTHRMYFADRPSDRLLDSLIDGLGPEAATGLLRRAIDAGAI